MIDTTMLDEQERSALVGGEPEGSLPSPAQVCNDVAIRTKKRRGSSRCGAICLVTVVLIVTTTSFLFLWQTNKPDLANTITKWWQQSGASTTTINNHEEEKTGEQPPLDSNSNKWSSSSSSGDASWSNDSTDTKPIRFDPDGTVEAEDPSWFVDRSPSRLEAVLQLVKDVSDPQALADPSSAPYQAARWMADQDLAHWDLPATNQSSDAFWFVQRYVLAVWYYALDGPNWLYKSHFMSHFDVCDWNFELDPETAPDGSEPAELYFGVQCNEQGVVDMIFMPHNHLRGAIPSEVGRLLDLYHVDLKSNFISHNLPWEFGDLRKLEYLNLESNLLSGSLPNWINELVSLSVLLLNDNHLTGSIPTLPVGLEEIALDLNQLTSGLNQLNDCPSLMYVYLSTNLLADQLDDNSLDNLENLLVLEAGDNLLTGSIPAWIYDMTIVDLHDNFLNQSGLPEVETEESPLEFLTLYGNEIGGTIPQSFEYLSNIVDLDLSDNKLTGTMPNVFTSSRLRSLYLYRNPFEESAFPDLSNCKALEELSLAETNLGGVLPDYIGQLSILALLDLRDNKLTGQLPESLGNLEWMQYLFLNRNSFGGAVPDSFKYLGDIVAMYLDNNQLDGSVNHICDASLEYLEVVSADCLSETIDCDCCNICCQSGDGLCNEWDDSLRLTDPSTRDAYLLPP